METRTYNVWSFDEAPEELRTKILENYAGINVDYEWWDAVYYDAEQIGLKITEFDIDRRDCNGQLTHDLPYTVQAITENHGPDTPTYKLAKRYAAQWAKLPEGEDETDEQYDLTEEFLTDLLGEYLTMLEKDYEYLTSEEAVTETLQANEYMFNEAGRID